MSLHVLNSTLTYIILGVMMIFAGACAGPQAARAHQANLNHVVLISLQDDADSGELVQDCDTLLLPIPEVRSYWAGTPLKIGRGNAIDGTYSVGLCIGFDDIADYRAYLANPDHIALVEKWKTRWTTIRLFDVISDP